KRAALVENEDALAPLREIEAVVREIDVALGELLGDVGNFHAVADRVAAHALRGDREQLGELRARILEARGRSVGDVVGSDGEIGLRRIQTAQGKTKGHWSLRLRFVTSPGARR